MQSLPNSPYAVTKVTGEQFCKVYYETYQLPTVALRYFNVYGPRQDPKSDYAAVVPKFIESGLKHQPLPIFGDGEQSRDMIYVNDVVDANIQAALSDKANGEIFNIASGSQTTVNDLAKLTNELTDNQNGYMFHPERPGDIKDSYADISKAKSMLNWKPKTKLRNGLKSTVKFFEDNQK
jgi:nucleoside-diphosphate-sugar epimerase